MYYDFTVPIPVVKGKITRLKKGCFDRPVLTIN